MAISESIQVPLPILSSNQVGKLVLTRSYTTIERLISQFKFALLASRLALDLIMNLGLRSKNGTFVCVT